MSEVTFTETEFREQVVEFRRMFGTKEFWNMPDEKRRIAREALMHAYMFLEESPKAVVQQCADYLTATLNECSRRELMILMNGGVVGK